MITAAPMGTESGGRLATLLTWLESDPTNLSLLSDAAEAAIAEREIEVVRDLLRRYAAIEPFAPAQRNLAGLAAMQAKDFEAARQLFQAVIDSGVTDPAVRFNLAWTLAALKDFPGATALLDRGVATAFPQAAMLRVQLLHEQGLIEEATAEARDLIAVHPDHQGLLAAVSVLALDADDEDLARRCATDAGGHPDALTTLGILALGDDRATEAREIFDRVLVRGGDRPRALIGRGLAKLLAGEAAEATADIDQGARMFGGHLGSWIAAGWAHFIKGDLRTCRKRFETALTIDPNFAETHGSLAVLDLLEGSRKGAEERCEIALRLDRKCYSAALARSLLATQTGNEIEGRRIYELALNMPIDGTNRTIAKALAKIGL